MSVQIKVGDTVVSRKNIRGQKMVVDYIYKDKRCLCKWVIKIDKITRKHFKPFAQRELRKVK